jgi:hypothetical protein
MTATVADVRRLALALRTIVVKMGFDERDGMIATAPHIFSVTPHYQDYPWVLVRLAAVTRARLAAILDDAWGRSAPFTRGATPPSGRRASRAAPARSRPRRTR